MPPTEGQIQQHDDACRRIRQHRLETGARGPLGHSCPTCRVGWVYYNEHDGACDTCTFVTLRRRPT